MATLFIPLLRQPEFRDKAVQIFRLLARRFRNISWICFCILIVTGIYNLAYRYGWSVLNDSAFWQTSVGYAFGLKLMTVLAILVLSAVHDFIIGPRATEAMRVNPLSPESQRLRKRAASIGRATLVLALITIALGVIMVRGWI